MPQGPGAVAFLQILVDAGHALLTHGGHRRRPHGLDDDLTLDHELDRFVEGRPEDAPVAILLELDETVDGVVDLLAGHVALVAVLDLAVGLERLGGIHEADLREGHERRLAGELRIDQLRPGIDGPADQVGPDAERIGVVKHRVVGDPLGRARVDEVGRIDAGRVGHRARVLAIAEPGIRPDLAGRLVEVDHRIPLGKLRGVPGLEVARRPHELHEHVGRLEEVARVGLRQRAGLNGRNLGGGLPDLEVESLVGHVLERLHVGHRHADCTHGDVLDVLRPYGREPAAKLRRRSDTGRGRRPLEDRAAAHARLALVVTGLAHAFLPRLRSSNARPLAGLGDFPRSVQCDGCRRPPVNSR